MTARDEDDRPRLWRQALALLLGLLVTVVLVAALAFTLKHADAFLTAQLGPVESELTFWTAFVTWLACQLKESTRHEDEP